MTTTKKIEFAPVHNINARAHRKENNFLNEFCLISLEKGDFETPVTLRIYGTNSKNSACIWIGGIFAGFDGYYISASGSGSAGGYGYHRPSAAAAKAFESAGVKLPFSIDGRGDSAIVDALTALAKHLKIKKFYIHKAHA
jgi:hypothetical protein